MDHFKGGRPKLADKTSNLRSLAGSPPPGWAIGRRQEYLDWARRVVDRCRAANPWLAGEFDKAAAELETNLES